MRRWLAAGLVIAGSASAYGQDEAAAFAPSLPAVVGDVSRWQVVSGSFETDAARGSYLLYVNPARGALYQLMRYRVELRSATSPDEKRRGGGERVAFIARPGAPEPMLCWEHLAGASPAWRPLAAGSAEYLLEMNVLMRVLMVHRAARAATP